jgi:hypothetical protein
LIVTRPWTYSPVGQENAASTRRTGSRALGRFNQLLGDDWEHLFGWPMSSGGVGRDSDLKPATIPSDFQPGRTVVAACAVSDSGLQTRSPARRELTMHRRCYGCIGYWEMMAFNGNAWASAPLTTKGGRLSTARG